jgi:hypothetical protein
MSVEGQTPLGIWGIVQREGRVRGTRQGIEGIRLHSETPNTGPEGPTPERTFIGRVLHRAGDYVVICRILCPAVHLPVLQQLQGERWSEIDRDEAEELYAWKVSILRAEHDAKYLHITDIASAAAYLRDCRDIHENELSTGLSPDELQALRWTYGYLPQRRAGTA